MSNLIQKFALSSSPIYRLKFWLAGVGLGLALLHLVLVERLMRQTDQVVLNGLFWFAILGTMAQSNNRGSDRLFHYIGLVVLGGIVAGSLAAPAKEAWFVRLFPAFAVFSLGLLISGFRLQQHWRTGLLVIPLMIPRGTAEQGVEHLIGQTIQILTAQFAAFILHYLGVDVVQKSSTISSSFGSVEVLFRCTGIPLLILLLQLTVLLIVVFPVAWRQQLRLVVIAAAIAFFFSSVRVALMAVVVKDPVAFEFWHGGNGSQLFSTGAIVLFGWICLQASPRI